MDRGIDGLKDRGVDGWMLRETQGRLEKLEVGEGRA